MLGNNPSHCATEVGIVSRYRRWPRYKSHVDMTIIHASTTPNRRRSQTPDHESIRYSAFSFHIMHSVICSMPTACTQLRWRSIAKPSYCFGALLALRLVSPDLFRRDCNPVKSNFPSESLLCWQIQRAFRRVFAHSHSGQLVNTHQ